MISIRKNFLHYVKPYHPLHNLYYRVVAGIVSFSFVDKVVTSTSCGVGVRADLRPAMCVQNPSLLVTNHQFDATSRSSVDDYLEKVKNLGDSVFESTTTNNE